MFTDLSGGQNWASGLLEQELQAVLIHQIWVLETELEFSGKAPNALKH